MVVSSRFHPGMEASKVRVAKLVHKRAPEGVMIHGGIECGAQAGTPALQRAGNWAAQMDAGRREVHETRVALWRK